MAQTIRIKRSSSATNPSNDIKEGELVYIHSNDTAGKLYIGRPGSASAGSDVAGNVDVIGGLIDSTKLSNIEANANNYSLPNNNVTNATVDGNTLTLTREGSGVADTTFTANNYSLPTAASDTLGGIKLGYADNDKNYALELDADNEAFVNVPWTDTVYTGSTGVTVDAAGKTIAIGQSVGTTDDVTFADITGDRIESSNGTLVTSGTTPAIVWKDTSSLDKDYSLANEDGTLTWKLHTNWNDEDTGASSDSTHEVIKINTYGMSIGSPTGGDNAGVMQNTPSLSIGFHSAVPSKFHSTVDVENVFTASNTVNLGAAAVAAVIGSGTAEDPEFPAVPAKNTTVKADLTVDGDLTVNGTTTTINTETITLADNVIELNRDVTGNAAIGSSALDGGLTVKRGTGNDSEGNPIYNASIKYHEVAGEWRANAGSSVGSVILTEANFSDQDVEIDGGTFS